MFKAIWLIIKVSRDNLNFGFDSWREKRPNTKFFLVCIFLYSDQKKLHIWTLLTQWPLTGCSNLDLIQFLKFHSAEPVNLRHDENSCSNKIPVIEPLSKFSLSNLTILLKRTPSKKCPGKSNDALKTAFDQFSLYFDLDPRETSRSIFLAVNYWIIQKPCENGRTLGKKNAAMGISYYILQFHKFNPEIEFKFVSFEVLKLKNMW